MDESAKRGQDLSIFVQLPGIDVGPGNYPPAYGLTGVDKNYPGYDGLHLPFEDESLMTVHSSHCLEHVEDPIETLREWFRVLKIGGTMIVYVPHQFLYEKKMFLPSQFNKDHKRFYTPAKLMGEVETALSPNSYRVLILADADAGFDYNIEPKSHSRGRYEIEMVLRKIQKPAWGLLA